MENIKVLYLHGLKYDTGSSATPRVLRELGFDVVEASLSSSLESTEDFIKNIEVAQGLADSVRPDIVVGSSMGGFTAMHVKGYMTLLINPCMLPSTRKNIYEKLSDLDSLKSLEKSVLFPDREVRAQTFALFGASDELFSFYNLFLASFSASTATFALGVGHRLKDEDVKAYVVPLLGRIMNTKRLISTLESNI